METSQIKKKQPYRDIFHIVSPTQIIAIGFFVIICVGTILLSLPIASKNGMSIHLEDAFFTASSAVCVTGLVVVNTLEHWTIFGQIVIILLIQVGGLGFMTIVTMVLLVAKRKITLKERILIQESLNQQSLQGMVKLVRRIVIGTAIFEGAGALILFIRFLFDGYGFARSLYMGVFHAISAFCNAGFDIIGDSSITPYVGDFTVNFVLMFLIIVGGLGFPVWMDLLRVWRMKCTKRMTWKNTFRRLNLHTKLVLTITPLFIGAGFVFFLICEYHNPMTLGSLSFGDKLLAALMQSVSPRTAGFNSISQSGMTYASKFMTILLMFVGGSPSGTAGGIKTVTLGVIIAAVISVIRGNRDTTIFNRKLPFSVLQKSLAITSISFGVLIVVTMTLTFTEQGAAFSYQFLDLLYEAASALGTVGMTTGITPFLSSAGKLIIAFTMYMGRIGPISIAVALASRQNKNGNDIEYPEERVMVG